MVFSRPFCWCRFPAAKSYTVSAHGYAFRWECRAVLHIPAARPESFLSQGSQIAGFSASYIWESDCPLYQRSMLAAFFVLLCYGVYQPVLALHRVVVGNDRLAGGQPAGSGLYLCPPVSHHGRRHDRTGQYRGQRPPLAPAFQPRNSDIPRRPNREPQANLTNWLNAFLWREQKRKTPFPASCRDAQP
ncbi:cellulose biosynthesis protein BcsG [Klebsiella pneumoniae]|nr:cellulose biosynthesis protein BcsG [Klebsiella pneumoniae]